MKWFVIAAITAVALFAWSLSRLSPETVGMAIGMLLGILAGLPAAALVIVVSRHTPPPDDGYIDVQPTYRPTYAAGMPALPDRQATIAELRQILAVLEADEVSR